MQLSDDARAIVAAQLTAAYYANEEREADESNRDAYDAVKLTFECYLEDIREGTIQGISPRPTP